MYIYTYIYHKKSTIHVGKYTIVPWIHRDCNFTEPWEAPFRIQSSRLVVLVVASSPKYAQFENITTFSTIFGNYKKVYYRPVQKPTTTTTTTYKGNLLTSTPPSSAISTWSRSADPWCKAIYLRNSSTLKGLKIQKTKMCMCTFHTCGYYTFRAANDIIDMSRLSHFFCFISNNDYSGTLSWPLFLVGRNLGLVFFFGGGVDLQK